MRVYRDGRVRLSAWTVPGHPGFDFLVNHWRFPGDGRDVYDPVNYDICANVRGKPVFFLHLKRRRVESAGFAYNLTPEELREVVSLLRCAGNGIERWIVPALERHQGSDVMKQDHAETHKIIPQLLDLLRELPVAEQWRRERRAIQRHWEKLVKEDPKNAAKAPAPWVLPNGRRSGRRSAPLR